ncbi:MAG: response regulator [Planctomycetes bacterium]|nr:response regulator [Planctomycetota bacterium]
MNKELVILMAEDNRGHFVLTENYLARMGVRNELIWFSDGREAINYLFTSDGHARSHPGKQFILFLDIRMPNMDGWEVLRRIKASPRLKNLPVVMLTAMENPEDIDKGMELGCSAYIVKPVKYSSYIDAMKKVGLFPSVVAGGVELMSKCSA